MKSKLKLGIIGADGQLGSDLMAVISDLSEIEAVPFTIESLNITNADQIESVLTDNPLDCLINTASYIQVDKAEDEPDKAFLVNATALKYLCNTCQKNGLPLLHLSTDYVFSGSSKHPYVEFDEAIPRSIYGISKLAGEQIIQYTLKQFYIVRVSGLYGASGPMGKSYNFVDFIVQKGREGGPLKVVDDQCLTPTYTRDLAEKIIELIQTSHYGLYHMTHSGECTWHAFAEEILKQCEIDLPVQKAKTGDFGEKAQRPAYSVLDNQKLREIGIEDFPVWQEGLKRYLIEKKYI